MAFLREAVKLSRCIEGCVCLASLWDLWEDAFPNQFNKEVMVSEKALKLSATKREQALFLKNYFYSLLAKYLSFYILPRSSTVFIAPASDSLPLLMQDREVKVFFPSEAPGQPEFQTLSTWDQVKASQPDYVVLNGNLHFEKDIQAFLQKVHGICAKETRLIICYYSSLWKPIFHCAGKMGWQTKSREDNWISPEDFAGFLKLTGFELVASSQRILFPFHIPFLSGLLNRWIAPLPFFRLFCLANVAVVRALQDHHVSAPPSVSVVVAARNEAGNIENLFQRLPKMGPSDELILVEGNSTDNTWATIQEMARKYAGTHQVKIAQQKGRGKGDAVRTGFDLAEKEILMILDADLTVAPEELPKFYAAIRDDVGEFINGSRLVYPMEKRAMRFFNVLGNKFFASAFTFVVGQNFKDTLCGTKVISLRNYRRLAASRNYFGEFDPFGDFDLLFGAARAGLKIVDLPVRYKERVYGETNISRWSHGWLLLRMVVFAARKIKFL